MAYQAVTHTATGAVLKWGYCDFTNDYDPVNESIENLNVGTLPIDGISLYYNKIVTGSFTEMTAGEKTAADAYMNTLFIPVLLMNCMSCTPVGAGVSKVIANGRQAIEVQDGVTGFAAGSFIWPLEQNADYVLRLDVRFILKNAGTGTKVRVALNLKDQIVGEDTSAAWDFEVFEVATVTHTTVGEEFSCLIEVDASGFVKDTAVAIQVGRDGANTMGAGDNDDVNVPIQIIGVIGEVKK